MAVAKVTLNGITLMDTTDATADASKILNTYTAYIGDGTKATGTASVTPSLQSKTKSYTPTETAQSETVTADSGYDGLSSVAVYARSRGSNYYSYVGTLTIIQTA